MMHMQAAHLPALASPVVAIAFCPELFALRPAAPGDAAVAATAAAASSPAVAPGAAGLAASPAAAASNSPQAAAGKDGGANAGAGQPLVRLPYRMVFAVATADSVFLYDTQVPCLSVPPHQ